LFYALINIVLFSLIRTVL